MIKQILLIGCVVFALTIVLMYLFQRHLIYFPDRRVPKLEQYHATDMTIVMLKTKDNLTLRSWYKPAQKNQPTLLYLHGNAGNIGNRMPLARQLIKEGFGVFLLEYRGYGGNRGTPTEKGFYEDARTAVLYLQQQGIKPKELVLYGESLGTGVATHLATEFPVCAIVLQSPYTSLANLSRYHYPWVFVKPWDQFNSLERIKSIHAPLLIIHGKQDYIVPYREAQELFTQANNPKKMLLLDRHNHFNLWIAQGFMEEVIQFIKKYC